MNIHWKAWFSWDKLKRNIKCTARKISLRNSWSNWKSLLLPGNYLCLVIRSESSEELDRMRLSVDREGSNTLKSLEEQIEDDAGEEDNNEKPTAWGCKWQKNKKIYELKKVNYSIPPYIDLHEESEIFCIIWGLSTGSSEPFQRIQLQLLFVAEITIMMSLSIIMDSLDICELCIAIRDFYDDKVI